MTRRRAAADTAAALQAVYDQVPAIDCQGLCRDSCARIGLGRAEQDRIQARYGVRVPDQSGGEDGPRWCPALTLVGQCGVYELRPLICRLWGVMEALPCNYGCRPVGGRYLTDAQAYELIAQVYEISGQPGRAAWVRKPWADPESAARAAAVLRGHRRDAHIMSVRRQGRR